MPDVDGNRITMSSEAASYLTDPINAISSSSNRSGLPEELGAQVSLTKETVAGELCADSSCDGDEDMSVSSEKVHCFRNYTDSARHDRVSALYNLQHENMTYDFVKQQHEKHLKFNKFKMPMWEVIDYLDCLVDDSDPDTEASQTQHALQSAEAARMKFPDLDWLHLVCLVHDCGKLLAVEDVDRGLHAAPQWLVVGDTFPVGCQFEETNVLHEFFANNPDSSHPVYSTKFGIYEPNCGLDNLTMSWGHDEYLYQVLVHNQVTLPPEGLSIIRYHSFYPWHKYGGYTHLASEADKKTLEWVQIFNEFDLYSKTDEMKSVAELKPYYLGLINKYMPGELQW